MHAAASPTPRDIGAESHNEVRAPLRFLHVEDDDVHAELTRLQLQEHAPQHSIKRVGDGEEALKFLNREGEYADAQRPDIILLDLHLPRMSGLEFLKAVQKHAEFCKIPTVVFTTSDAPADRDEAYRLAANSYMCKPINFERFGEVLRKMVEYWWEADEGPFS